MAKKKEESHLAVLAFFGAATLILALIIIIWWSSQSPAQGTNNTDNRTVLPLATNYTPVIPEPPSTEPGTTGSFFSLSNTSDGTLVTTGNDASFLCPNGWIVDMGHNETFAGYDAHVLRCASGGGSFAALYSILNSSEGPDQEEAMAALKQDILMEGGSDFHQVGSATEYSYSIGSIAEHGIVLFSSCGNKISMLRVELPASDYGSSVTPFLHSFQCSFR